MEPHLKHFKSIQIVGLSVRSINRNEANAETAKIPGNWEKFFQEGVATKIPNTVPSSSVYGVYSDYESDLNGAYTLTAGLPVLKAIAPLKYSSVQIAEGNYLVFEAKGEVPFIVINTWKTIWDYFSSHQELTRAYKTDFELYKSKDEVEIWIGVKE